MCQMIGKCTKVDGEVVCNAGKTLLDFTKDSTQDSITDSTKDSIQDIYQI